MNRMVKLSLRLALLSYLTVGSSVAWAGGGQGACNPFKTCVPEPASLALLGVGVGAILLYRNRRGPRK